jgi:glycosyltransferase involved in cell wall biosynthesis
LEKHLRICLIAFMFAPLVGGSEIQAEKQARQLQTMGHEVTILTLRHYRAWKRTEILDGLPIIRVGGIYKRDGRLRIGRLGHLPIDFLFFLTVWRLRNQFDIFHSFQLSTIAAVATWIGKISQIPIIINIPSAGPGKAQQKTDAVLMADTLTERDFLKISYKDVVVGDIAYLHKSAFGGKAMLRFLKKSDAYYQILSTRCLPYMTSHGFRAEQVILIPNGVDSGKFQPAPQRPDPAQPERTILCVARWQYPKGIDVLLHAWGRLMREPDAWRTNLKPRLLLAGYGPLETQLKHIAELLDIQESVEFLGLRQDVIELLQQSWGFVMPSRWEGMPNALLEGMSCGLPCIATRVSGSEDIIIDGVNGLLVEPEQPQELAVALRRMIGESDLAQSMAEEGRATILHDYELDSVMKRCVEMYYRVSKNSGKHTHKHGREGVNGE